MPRDSLAIVPADPDLAQAPWWRRPLRSLPADLSRRGAGFALALAIELLIVLLLLSLGLTRDEPDEETVAITSFDVSEPPAEPSEEQPASQPEATSADDMAEPQIEEPTPVAPAVVPLPSALPMPSVLPAPQPGPTPTPSPTRTSRIGAVVRSDRSYGPADTGSSRGEDNPIVGTAPDGSPLYAASWYREPTHDQLAGYLSTASSTGWGLIACRTAPNWRVEDCEIVGESPANSGIARAVQAAAWQFLVRPPRIGGEYQVGSWVRIRIDYTRSQRPIR